MSLQLSCDDSKSALDLLKLALRNSDCQEWINCDNKDISLDAIAKLLIQQGADGSFAVNVCGCGGSTPGPAGLISVTYAELVALIGSSGLTAGAFYLLTDFATKHYFTDDGDTLNVINTGTTEPLILFATAVNKIDTRAWSPSFPQDVIHYEWDAAKFLADISFSSDGNNIVTGWKGVITYRWDTKQDNYTGYDFRNVKFRRWALNPAAWDNLTSYAANAFVQNNNKIYISLQAANVGHTPASSPLYWAELFDITLNKYQSWSSDSCIGIAANENDYYDKHTFSNYDEFFRMNHIEPLRVDNNTGQSYYTMLNNITLDYYCYNINIASNTFHVSIGASCYDIRIGNESAEIVLGRGCYDSFYGQDCWDVLSGDDTYWLSLPVATGYLYLGKSCSHILFNPDCMRITIGNGSNELIFNINCEDIILGGGATEDIFENHINSLNLTGATHIYGNYSCRISKRLDGTARLTYIDNSDVQQIVAATA